MAKAINYKSNINNAAGALAAIEILNSDKATAWLAQPVVAETIGGVTTIDKASATASYGMTLGPIGFATIDPAGVTTVDPAGIAIVGSAGGAIVGHPGLATVGSLGAATVTAGAEAIVDVASGEVLSIGTLGESVMMLAKTFKWHDSALKKIATGDVESAAWLWAPHIASSNEVRHVRGSGKTGGLLHLLANLDASRSNPSILDRMRVVMQQQPDNDIEWIGELLASTEKLPTSKLISRQFGWIIRMTSSNRFDVLDNLLQLLPTQSINTTSLLSFARGTSKARSKLSHWRSFIAKVAKELDKRGLDTAHLLRGLV